MDRNARDGNSAIEPLVRRGWLRVIVLFPVLVASSILIQGPLEIWLRYLGAPPLGTDTGDELVIGLQLVRHLGSLAAAWLAIYLMCRVIDRRPMRSLGIAPRPAALAEGWLWGAGLVVVVVGLLLVSGQVSGPRWRGVGDPGELAAAFLLFLAASVVEELVFRAYFLVNLVPSLGRWPAVAVSSCLFGFAHAGNPDVNGTGFINIVLAGVLLSVTYVHRRRFWAAVTLHLAWNFTQGPLLGFDVSGLRAGGVVAFETPGAERWTGGGFGLEGSLVTVLVLVLAVGLMEFRELRAASPDLS